MSTTLSAFGNAQPGRGHRKTKSFPNLGFATPTVKRESPASVKAGAKRQREVSGKLGESATHHAHHRFKSCLDPITTTITPFKYTISAAEASKAAIAGHYLEMLKLGLKFDPTEVCGIHQKLPKIQALTEIVKKRQLQIDTVKQLVNEYQEHGGVVPYHFAWEQGNWQEYCESQCVCWFDYFREQVRESTVIYKGDMFRYGDACVGCFLERWHYPVEPTWALADAILKDTPPDVSPFEPEVGILLMDAWAYHRGEKCTYWDLPDFSDDDGEETP